MAYHGVIVMKFTVYPKYSMAEAKTAAGGNSRAQRYKKLRKGPQFELRICASLARDNR